LRGFFQSGEEEVGVELLEVKTVGNAIEFLG
jgi:hypothetical protein